MVVYIKYRHDIQATIMIFYGGRVVQHWVALVSLRFEKRCKFLPLDNFLLFFFFNGKRQMCFSRKTLLQFFRSAFDLSGMSFRLYSL